MTHYRLFLGVVPLALAACSVGPDYKEPTIDLAKSYAEGTSSRAGSITATRWWRSLGDAQLNTLIDRGLAQNLNVRTAIERIAEAQAAVRATGLNAAASGSLTGTETVSGGSDITTTDTATATFNPSVIIDLFGGERRNRERALARLEAAELGVGEARLAFLSSLVSNYLDARYYQATLEITRRTIASREQTLSLVNAQHEAGSATELELMQSRAARDEARATLPSLEAGFYAATYAIATLLAEPVQTFQAELERGAAQPRPSGGASVGVPADLLRNRPDIMVAERDFATAVAGIGVSEAQLYPSLSLGGTVNASDSTSWSFGPSLSLPVLNQGSLRASRDQAISQAKQAELAWRSTVLSAVEEVQSAQSSYIRSRREVAATQDAVTSYARVTELSEQTYEVGTTTLLDLLDSQRSLGSARLSHATAIRDLARNWATLQIEAGAGWRVQ